MAPLGPSCGVSLPVREIFFTTEAYPTTFESKSFDSMKFGIDPQRSAPPSKDESNGEDAGIFETAGTYDSDGSTGPQATMSVSLRLPRSTSPFFSDSVRLDEQGLCKDILSSNLGVTLYR